MEFKIDSEISKGTIKERNLISWDDSEFANDDALNFLGG